LKETLREKFYPKYILLILGIAIVAFSGLFASSSEMFMATPKYADELKRFKNIHKIVKEDATVGFLKKMFSISDDRIAEKIYLEIQKYSGDCPCPYNQDSAKHWCGGNSAYTKPRGAEPLCYPADVVNGLKH
jgi:hypothetical protein